LSAGFDFTTLGLPQILISIVFGALLATGFSTFLDGFSSRSSDACYLAFFGLDILSIAFFDDDLLFFFFFFDFDLRVTGGSSTSSFYSFGSSTSATVLFV
jgi:hypothetical protein